jgi:hypothetical protein
MRLALLRLDESAWYAAWTLHHLITDGWSVQLVMAEVLAVYAATVARQPIPDMPAGRYRDYIAWLQRQDLGQAERFWRRTIDGFATPSLVAGAVRSAAHQTIAKRSIYTVLPAAVMNGLQDYGRVRALTMNTALVGAWALVLAQQTGTDDVMFGTVVSGRPPQLPGIERTPGMFVNTLPVRARVAPHASLGAWLQQLQAQQTEAREYEYTPLSHIQGWSSVPASTPLFDTLFAYENYPVAPPRDDDMGLRVMRSDTDVVIPTTYPIVLEFAPSAEAIGIRMTFDTARLPDASAREILDRFQALLERVASSPDETVGSLLEFLASHEAEVRTQEREAVQQRQQSRLKDLRRAATPSGSAAR